MLRGLIGAAVVAASLLCAAPAMALTCSSSATGQVSTTLVGTCGVTGSGSFDQSNTNFSSYLLLDNTQNTDGLENGKFVTGVAATTFLIPNNAYTNLAIVAQIADTIANLGWVTILLQNGNYFGTTAQIAPGVGLHISSGVLYGMAAVPLPAGLPLLAAGIGLLGLLAWRQKRKSGVSATVLAA